MEEGLMNFDLPQKQSSIIKVIGVGGGGGNAVNHMFRQGITDVDFLLCNTDAQALANSPVPVKIQLGETLTKGRGAGNKPEAGRDAAIESLDKISEILSHNTEMVFITAGMGGGTGTGAAPVIAAEAKDMGILTVGIVTLPFFFEGRRRMNQAIDGLNQMREHVDSLLVINNEKIREIYGNLTLSQAFARADDVLTVAAKGIAEIITVHGYINVDFADVQTVMANSGVALMVSATAEGENRAVTVVEQAIASPLLNNNDISGAKNVLLNIAYSEEGEAGVDELEEIAGYVKRATGENSDVIWGVTIDPSLGDSVGVTIIATGFGNESIPELNKPTPEQKEVLPLIEKEPESNTASEKTTEKQNEDIVFEVIDTNGNNNEENASEETPVPKQMELFSLFDDDEGSKKPETKQFDLGVTPAISVNKAKRPKASYSNESDIERLEREPAYKRKGVTLDEITEIELDEEEVSKYTLTEEKGNSKISKDNPFLFDNVD